MKRIITILCIMVLLTSFIAFAVEDVTSWTFEDVVETSVMLNGVYLTSDTPHILVNDKVYIVGRYLVEALGGQISWDDENRSVHIVLDGKNIVLPIDAKQASVDGQTIELEDSAFIRDDRTMIPLRFVAENLGCQVAWQQETYTVVLTKEGLEVAEEYVLQRWYTDDDLYTLSKIVTVESGDVSLEMAIAIANTVINRVNSDQFPNTISDVIYEVDVHVQFPPAHKESFKILTPSFLARKAAKKALEGVNVVGPSLFFNNSPFPSKAGDLLRIIDGEYFYK